MKYGISTGSHLGSVFANIIVEKTIFKDLFDKSWLKVYMRYADDTLLLVKEKDITYTNTIYIYKLT